MTAISSIVLAVLLRPILRLLGWLEGHLRPDGHEPYRYPYFEVYSPEARDPVMARIDRQQERELAGRDS